MDRLLTDPAGLRRRLDELTATRKSEGLTARTLEALAECSFRLAVHPKTPPQEALDLLRKAASLEPGNPKHPYHIARIYTIHGEFDQAAEWLRVAAVRYPTSHRVWAHIALIQRELSARYKVDVAYDGEALLKVGAEINARIKGGADKFETGLLTFVPPPSQTALDARQGPPPPPEPAAGTEPFPEGVERLSDPGKCRWGGVVDLEMEGELQKEVNKATLRAILPSLEAAGRAASGRPDLLSAFVVLAIEWVLTGYPPTSVRRLCPVPLPPDPSTPELDLLDIVLRAFEAPLDHVPALLAGALDRGRLPTLLAAVIHHHRLLAWRPLDFEPAATLAAARRFLKAVRDGDPEVPAGDKLAQAVRRHREPLIAARKALKVAPRAPIEEAAPAPVADATPFDGASAREQLGRLRDDAATLKGVKVALVKHILERVVAPWQPPPDPAACARAAGDRPAVERIRDEVKQAGATGQAKLDALKLRASALTGAELGPDFAGRRDACEKDLRDARNVGNIAGMLKRADAAREAAHEHLGREPAPESAECRAMSVKVAGLFKAASPAVDADPAEAPPPTAPTQQAAPPATREREVASTRAQTPVGFLEADLASAESDLATLYDRCLAEFDAYSRRSRSEPAMAELIATVRRFEADTLYRTGRRRAARAIWNRLLRDNRLDTDLLHKLAVADTYDPDPAVCLASWRAYAEVLYFRDVVADNPRPGARQRAELHRHLAGAYGPPGLTPRRDQTEPEPEPAPEVIVAFLNNPGRVRSYVAHKLLEFASARLDYTSPPILLGVARGDGPVARETARKRWGAFLDGIAPLLPDRVRCTFVGTCRRHLDAALKSCESAGRLLRRNDPHYDDEQKRHVRWLAEVVELKARLRGLIFQAENLDASLTSITFLDELARLDLVPIDTNPDWLRDAARSVFKPKDLGDVLPDLPAWFEALRDHVLLPLIIHVFRGPDTDSVRRDALYQNLVGPWLRHGAIWKKCPQAGNRSFADLLDDPSAFYPKDLLADLDEKSPGKLAMSALPEWCRRYPRLTGPARHLATTQMRCDKIDDAAPLLDAAIAAAFHDGGRAECLSLKRHLEVARALKGAQAGNLDAANAFLEILREDDGDPMIARQVIHGFIHLAQKARKDPGAEGLASAVDDWLRRARLSAPGKELGGVETDRDDALVMIALAPGGGHTKTPEWDRIVDDLTQLLRRHPELKKANYWRMTAYWQRASAASKRKDGDATRRNATLARDDAREVAAAFPDTDMATQANQIIEQLD